MKKTLALIAIILSAIASYGCGSAHAVNPEDVRVGNTIPDFSLKTLDGNTVSKKSLKGEPVILNFWASWCGNCREEIPELRAVAESTGVKILGIALDETGERTIRPAAESFKINYPVLIGDQETFQQFNGVAIPYTLVLDGSQRIVKIYRGHVSKSELETDLKNIAGSSS